ncbi:MAG: cobalt-precorrin-6A reductase [Magnetovibrio sp.]|nr:cobalt-precorrin-6A reductase [Magnetovibrio sp.]
MSLNILILGGTGDSIKLYKAIQKQMPDLKVVLSEAGITHKKNKIKKNIRVGGFGGVTGLIEHLETAQIDAVIDATHPFAAQITAHAVEACTKLKLPRLRLDRPQWIVPSETDVMFVPDAEAAARIVARTSSSAFLTIGRKTLSAFDQISGVKLLVRLIEVPPEPLKLENCTIVTGRPPFSLAAEEALMRAHRIDTLVSKASGGEATRAKIDAAAKVGARIILIRRPPAPDGDHVFSIDEAVNWVKALKKRD